MGCSESKSQDSSKVAPPTPKVVPPPPEPVKEETKDQKAAPPVPESPAKEEPKEEAKEAAEGAAKEEPADGEKAPENPSKEDAEEPADPAKEDNEEQAGEGGEGSAEVGEGSAEVGEKKKKKKHRKSIKDPSQVPEGEEDGDENKPSDGKKKKKKKRHGEKEGEKEGEEEKEGETEKDETAAADSPAAEGSPEAEAPAEGAAATDDAGESKGGLPDFAAGWGFTPELPQQLKEYYSKHGLELPDFFQEPNGVWLKLQDSKSTRDEIRENLLRPSSFFNLFKGDDMVNQLQASPGETLEVVLKGCAWTSADAEQKQQILLCMDAGQVLGEIYEGAPAGKGEEISKNLEIKAPEEPGVYMLWRYADAQEYLEKAKSNLAENEGQAVKARFPEEFVGMLIVSQP